MKIDVLTLFPDMFEGVFKASLIGKAVSKSLLSLNAVDIRSFSKDKNKKVDDKPFGGGPGMVIKAQPVYDAIKSVGNKVAGSKKGKPYVAYMSPQGHVFNNQKAIELSKHEHIVILCGHYEGVDERVLKYVDEEISIGDYILTGGEIAAMVVIDAVARMVKGVVKEEESVKNDSFYNGLLDYPHYTRPASFRRMKVPPVLLSGNHKKIEEWRKLQALQRTKARRPDLLERK